MSEVPAKRHLESESCMPMTNRFPCLHVVHRLICLLPLSSFAGDISLSDCYARWDEQTITVGNAGFERVWMVAEAGLSPVSFVIKNPDVEWLADAARKEKPTGSLEVKATTARRTVVGSEGLRVEVTTHGKIKERQLLWIFPGLSGVIAERLEGAMASVDSEQRKTTGIEVEPASQPAGGKSDAGGETLRLQPRHLRVSETTLRDQTDHHGELVQQREWLLWANESPFDIRGCVVAAENALDGSGIAFLKLAPLPHARPDPQAVDFRVRPGQRAVTGFFHGYPMAAVAYRGGMAGRTRAFHSIQRVIRNHLPERDGMFMSNTWGDRSRDARINEEFILREIEAGAALGVDVVQVDDGWQKGRSSNSADARGKGVWNGYWAADPEFWSPDPVRFPRGLKPVVEAARGHGMRFGFWFGPDSSHDAANWQRDADHLLEMHRDLGVDFIKVDSMKTTSTISLQRQRAMFDRILEGSKGAVSFDLDITAEIRPGYFGLPDIGPVYLENRYTDWGTYWPHLTLRNLWMLAQTVDPMRMRIEVLNHLRNEQKYGEDPLAPARYRADTLFAIAMMANPLAFFEVSNYPAVAADQMKPLVKAWKQERARMHGGAIVPVGSAPDGVAWTGFASVAADGKSTYVLLFRELNESPEFTLALPCPEQRTQVRVLGGRGSARLADGTLTVRIPEKLDYVWLKLE